MERTINAKQLRALLPSIVKRVQRGERFTVIYRSRPAFRLLPISEPSGSLPPLQEDTLYRADAVGRSNDGLTSADHDALLYGIP
jgi:antitoxin (DNA-binding transcriptional repressor) of toxin-antitoxin stability system